jgi:hypothetical protein
MAQRQIFVNLQLATAQFEQRMNQLQSKVFGQFQGMNQQLQGSFFGGGGAFNTAAWISAFSIIERAGTAAFNGIGNAIGRAAKYQTNLVSSANNYQAALELSFGDSLNLAKDIEKAMKVNAALPFGDLRRNLVASFGDDILAQIYDKNDPSARAPALASLAKTMGDLSLGLGNISGVTDPQRRDLVGKVLSSNAKGVRGIEGYTNSPLFQKRFDEAIAQLGGDNIFDKLSKVSRVAFLQRVADGLVSPETLKEYQNSFAGRSSKIMALLFDDQNGVFSFARELPGGVSVINSFNKILGELVTPGGIFDLGGAIIAGFADGFFGTISFVAEGIAFLLKPINVLLGITKPLNGAIYALSFALSTLATIGIAKMTYQAGIALATQGVSGIAGLIGIAPGVIAMIPNIMGTIKALPLLGIGVLGKIFTGIIAGIGAIATALSLPFAAVVAVLIGIGALGVLIWSNWKPVSEFFTGFFRMIVSGLNTIASVFMTIVNIVSQGVDSLVGRFTGVSGITQKITSNPAGAATLRGLVPMGLSPLIDLLGAVGNVFTGNRAGGNVPNSFISMINSEIAQKPSGSGLVIANDSEVILNRSQQRGVAQAIAGASSGGNRMSVQVVINGFNGSVDDLANKVKQSIEQQWSAMLYEDA